MRAAVRKCLADSPSAIVIDISGLTVVSDVSATVFIAVQRHQPTSDGVVPVMLYADPVSRPATRVRAVVGGLIPVHTDRAAALLALRRGASPRLRAHLHIAPAPGSAAMARAFTGDFCRRTGLGHLVDSAQIVAHELISNSLRHAGTEMSLSLVRGQTTSSSAPATAAVGRHG